MAAVGDVEREARAICTVAVESFGRLDIVVNNAGIQPVAPLRSIGDDELAEMFRVNAAGRGCDDARGGRRSWPATAARSSTSASIEAFQPAFDHSHYAASKAAVVMHTRAAALELGPAGIRVNCVSPGLVEAPGIEQSWPEGVARWRASAPLERLGKPERRRRRGALSRLPRRALDHRRDPRRRRRRPRAQHLVAATRRRAPARRCRACPSSASRPSRAATSRGRGRRGAPASASG